MNLTLKIRLQSPDEPVVETHQVSTVSGKDNTTSTMTLDVYGMSRCPYFSQIMVNEIQYLIDTYPMATKILKFATCHCPSRLYILWAEDTHLTGPQRSLGTITFSVYKTIPVSMQPSCATIIFVCMVLKPLSQGSLQHNTMQREGLAAAIQFYRHWHQECDRLFAVSCKYAN